MAGSARASRPWMRHLGLALAGPLVVGLAVLSGMAVTVSAAPGQATLQVPAGSAWNYVSPARQHLPRPVGR
jgi:hypothetical protein